MSLIEKALVKIGLKKTRPEFSIRRSGATIPIEFIKQTGKRVIAEIDTTPPDTLVTHISPGVDIFKQGERQGIQLVETKYTIRIPPKTPLLGS